MKGYHKWGILKVKHNLKGKLLKVEVISSHKTEVAAKQRLSTSRGLRGFGYVVGRIHRDRYGFSYT